MTISESPDVREHPELAEFRARARAWLDANAPRRQPRGQDADAPAEAPTLDLAASKAFQAKLFDGGFAGLTWPAAYGGQGLSNEHQRVWAEETADRDIPVGPYTIGLGMVMPTMLEFGTEAQKERYVPKALRGEEIWAQLFSEPGAGSDVASLQTRAERDGDEWVLNGQKVWTSGAHYSDYGAVIARTNPDQPKHRGITMFILDFKQRGVLVKPLKQMTGDSSFNEVFFDDVRIPHTDVIGQVDDGWRCAIAMLMNERVAIGAGGAGPRRGTGNGIDSLTKLAERQGRMGDPVVRQGLADIYIRSRIMGFIGQRIRAAVKAGRAPGPEGSIAKLSGATLSRDMSDLAIEIAGPAGAAWGDADPRGSRWAMMVLAAPASRIAGGTDEVQRNIIGERVLGLPKEPQVDRDIPFRELRVGTQKD